MKAVFKSPRDLSAVLVEAFLDGKPQPENIAPEFEHLVDLAKTEARNVAALVVHHSRRHRGSKDYVVPALIWPLVKRYEAARRAKR